MVNQIQERHIVVVSVGETTMHETVEDTESRSNCVVFKSNFSVLNPVRSSAVIAADTG